MSGAVKQVRLRSELPIRLTIDELQVALDDAIGQGAPYDARVTVKHIIGNPNSKEYTLVDIIWTEDVK